MKLDLHSLGAVMEKCTFSSVPLKQNGHGTETEQKRKKTPLKHERAREQMMRKYDKY